MAGQTVGFPGLVLYAHLSGQTLFLGKLCQMPGFVQFMRKRFLQVNVFSPFHRIHGGGVVGMVGGGDGNCIDLIVEFGKHFPVILKGGGTLKLFRPGIDFPVGIIDIAEANHFNIFMLGQVDGINPPFAPGADMGGANLTVG